MPAAGLLLALIITIYCLRLAAQVAVTPIGEALDYGGHLAYIVFMAEQGRPPSPSEPSMPDWILHLASRVPGPDHSSDGSRYRAWAALDPAARAQARAELNRDTRTAAYLEANNHSQHPPLYYWLLSRVYRAFPPSLGLEARLYLLGLVSVGLSAVALPGLYQTFRLYVRQTPALLALLALVWYPNLWPFLARTTNDSLAFPLLVWAFYFCLRFRASHQFNHLLLAGGLLALACFTKTYALTLLPVYLLCAALPVPLYTPHRPDWRSLLVAAPLALGTVGALFAFNLLTTGHLIPLTEMRLTASLPLSTRLAALFQVDPVWFAGGMAKNFWWVGYWSFVSPGVLMFLPLAAPLVLIFLRPRVAGPWSARLGLPELWPHYAALAFFGAGMLWHAALFTLEARLSGLTRHSGNEGWYVNVLLGSVWVIGLLLLRDRVSAAALRRILTAALVVCLVTSLISQAAVNLYWGGAVVVSGVGRVMPWGQFFAALFNPVPWANWLSLPGIVQPVAWTGLLPLILALAGTALAWRQLTVRQAVPAPAAASAVPQV